MSTASAQLDEELLIGAEMIRDRTRRLAKAADELRRLTAKQLELQERRTTIHDQRERQTA